jgi:hypothetical protein
MNLKALKLSTEVLLLVVLNRGVRTVEELQKILFQKYSYKKASLSFSQKHRHS